MVPKESKRLESKFVRKVMAGASQKEIEEATKRWFAFLDILNRIAEQQEAEQQKPTSE